MGMRRRVDWSGIGDMAEDVAHFAFRCKGRIIALSLGGLVSVWGYNAIHDPEFIKQMEQTRQESARKEQELQKYADEAQVRGPGRGAMLIGALTYTFDFNANSVLIAGEDGTQTATFESVYKGELAKKVKASICADSARRDKFGLHYCQQ